MNSTVCFPQHTISFSTFSFSTFCQLHQREKSFSTLNIDDPTNRHSSQRGGKCVKWIRASTSCSFASSIRKWVKTLGHCTAFLLFVFTQHAHHRTQNLFGAMVLVLRLRILYFCCLSNSTFGSSYRMENIFTLRVLCAWLPYVLIKHCVFSLFTLSLTVKCDVETKRLDTKATQRLCFIIVMH